MSTKDKSPESALSPASPRELGDDVSNRPGFSGDRHRPRGAFEEETTQVTDARKLVKGRRTLSRSPGQAHIIIIGGSSVGQVFPLDPRETHIGRGRENSIQIPDLGISRDHAIITRDEAGRYAIQDRGSSNGTRINGQLIHGPVMLTNNERVQLGTDTVVKFLEHGDPEADYAVAMYEAAMTDGLTGVFNRRYLEICLASEVAFSRRHGIPLGVLLMDLDHFKRVNDTYGHVAGDHVLTQFARLAAESIRIEDTLARYGGEEFVIVCRAMNHDQALLMAERIRGTVEATPFTSQGQEIRATVSIGVAVYPGRGDAPDATTLLQRADRALYTAKSRGRNQVALEQSVTVG